MSSNLSSGSGRTVLLSFYSQTKISVGKQKIHDEREFLIMYLSGLHYREELFSWIRVNLLWPYNNNNNNNNMSYTSIDFYS